eukprot:3660217-Prymnesium_polylepis.1
MGHPRATFTNALVPEGSHGVPPGPCLIAGTSSPRVLRQQLSVRASRRRCPAPRGSPSHPA